MDKHVPKLEYCQRLKELGWPQKESLFCHYFNAGKSTGVVVDGGMYRLNDHEYWDRELRAAPLVSEMMTLIPDNFSCGKDGDGRYRCSNNKEFFGEETLADACADCLVTLAKKGLIKLNA